MNKISVEQTLNKARNFEKKGEIAKAYVLYKKILHDYPKNLRASNALTILEKIRQNNITHNPPSDEITKLVDLYNKKQFSKVIEKAKALSDHYTNIFLIWSLLGSSAAQIGMLDVAIEACEKSIYLAPDHPEPYSNLGNILKEQGKFDDAIDAYNLAIACDPYNDKVYNSMGIVLKIQNKICEAIKSYKKAISLNPNNAICYYNMGNLFADQEMFDEAVKSIKKQYHLILNTLKLI